MMKNLLKNIPLMAFVLGFGLIIAMSSFKANSGKALPITYHIVQDLGDRYEVTTDGRCDEEPVDPCSLESGLSPNMDGEILKADLENENPDYEETIIEGTFVPAP